MNQQEKDKIVRKLIDTNTTISTMESCTSGLIASMITDTEGASAVFPGGYSKQCARAMAETAQKNLHTEIAVGITGTTGNVDPNNADSMQGKVFFCILVGENAYDYEYNAEVTRMSRHEIKELYADKVFEELAKLINIVHSSSDLSCDSV
jgi:nicotinamide-nucleotide amidase